MLVVNDNLTIPDSCFEWQYSRAGGPGGQHVNKVNTQAQLSFSVRDCQLLSEPVKARLIQLAGRRYLVDGRILLRCEQSRSQSANRDECLNRLRAMILSALIPPRKRKPTRPTLASRQRRLDTKTHRASTKQQRRAPAPD